MDVKLFLVMLQLALFAVVTCALGDESAVSNDCPQVVKISPENGDMNVDPGTSNIIITFDRSMSGGYSFCRGVGANWNHHPESTGKAYWNQDKTQITFPVKLRSGWEYSVCLNCKRASNFRSREGRPLHDYPYTFRTLGESVPLVDVPHVLKVEPANGAKNVPASTKIIRVTFDRRMADGSWSVCRSKSGTWDDFPKVTGKLFYDESHKVLNIPVDLELGKTYKLQFNNGDACAFQDEDGHSLEDYPYMFTTVK